MKKIVQIAKREFLATVATKAFVLGLILPPVIMFGIFALMPLLMNKAAPKVTGHVAIIDRSGTVADRVKESFAKEKIAKRMAEQTQQALETAGAPKGAAEMAKAASSQQSAAVEAGLPNLSVVVLPPDTDVESAKAMILTAQGGGKQDQGSGGGGGEGGEKGGGADNRLALAVIEPETVKAGEDGKFKGFSLYTAPKLDFEVQRDVDREIGQAIVDARIEGAGLDTSKIRAITDRPRGEVISVTEQGDKKINDMAKLLVPGAFMFLLWIATFTCGQYLLTSTIEEKSSRVMEVILSAASPMELLTGKILGQMGAGLVILVLYCGAGIGALIFASMLSIVPLINLVYLLIYFVIAFFMIAALMAAIGSAVSDIREAQSLLGPVMIVLIIPMALWMPILRNPNSMFAQVCSFVPPTSPFVMILRLSGSEAVPTWQIPVSIALGAVYVWIALWAAAKVFRVGVLMYGKPPDFRTLWKWIKMA